jgi:hypothetical protein
MNQAADGETKDLAAALPPRYRWLKRLAAGLGLFFAFVFVLRLWWGHEADRRLQAEINRIQAAGEPIFPEDFNPTEDIPKEHNAALALIKAFEVYDTTYETKEFPALVEMTDEDWSLIAQGVADNAETLALIRSARSMSQLDWGLRFRSPAINIMLPQLSAQRALARMLARFSAYYHHTGKDVVAIELLRDGLHQSELVQEPPMLISYLVGTACSSLTVHTIEFMAHELVVGEFPGASREQVNALINDLFDDHTFQAGLRSALYGERMFQLDCVTQIVEGELSFMAMSAVSSRPSPLIGVLGYPIEPLFQLDGVRMIEHMNGVARAVEEPNWPATNRIIGPLETKLERSASRLEMLKKPVSMLMMPSLGRAVQSHYRALAERRMAAIALAMRLYELDHGRRPRELAELVPEYLPAVPLDPMAEGDRPITYLPDAKQPILYSIGDNGTDDGGAYVIDAKGRVQRDESDIVFYLDGQRPQPGKP